VEKAGFRFRVAKGLESREMSRCDVHGVRISVTGVTDGNSLIYIRNIQKGKSKKKSSKPQ
jgi:hypothetical protein